MRQALRVGKELIQLSDLKAIRFHITVNLDDSVLLFHFKDERTLFCEAEEFHELRCIYQEAERSWREVVEFRETRGIR